MRYVVFLLVMQRCCCYRRANGWTMATAINILTRWLLNGMVIKANYLFWISTWYSSRAMKRTPAIQPTHIQQHSTLWFEMKYVHFCTRWCWMKETWIRRDTRSSQRDPRPWMNFNGEAESTYFLFRFIVTFEALETSWLRISTFYARNEAYVYR